MCESEATATGFFVRKRSDSNRELFVRKRSADVAAATKNVFCAKAKC
ncbi:hypothetical protein [Lysinibacillus sp. fls2-241-R2A-57]|nr:hypothetical protein [Lysinibacillus sp. fls2-241-R2A-57]